MATVNDKMTAIADAIREKTGSTEPLTLDGMAESIPEVYEAGKGAMWDVVQNNGNRTDYTGAFAYWGAEEITPKHKVAPTSYSSGLFKECRNLKRIDKDLFDLSSAKYYPNDERSANYELCAQCRALEVFPDIGLQPGYYGSTWGSCMALKTIEILRTNADCGYSVGTFRACRELVDILDIEGEIGQNIWFVQSPLLSPATMKRIIKHLKIYKQTEHEYECTITFNPTAFAVLEAEGISEEDWEWLAEQFPDVDIELVKLMVENSWEMLIGLCLGWNVTVG